MKKLALNNMKKSFLALSVVSLLAGSTCQIEAKSCDMRTFNIKIAEKVSTNEILNQLSSECGFSVITKDSFAKEKMDEKLYGINIKNMALNEIFDVLVASKGLDFDYNKNVLKISGLLTKTFKIDYVTTSRVSKSNTDISLTGDSGGGSAGTQSDDGSSLSTGATITSSDKFSFWEVMGKELNSILNASTDTFKTQAPIINKEAGLVTVSGTTEQLQRVQAYIDTLMNRLHKQVMIDVKILSVNLDNSKQTGINWGELYKLQNVKVGYESVNTQNVGTYSENSISDVIKNGVFHANLLRLTGSTSVTDLVKFLKTQGDVTSISNPKVVTLSNQPAVFSSGDQLYYKLSASSRQTGGAAATETYNNEVVKSVFAGILLDITPQITDDGEVILKINPSISSVKSEVAGSDGVRRLPPDLQKKQISSVVKLRDGEKIVLGGLISSRQGKGSYKVPILGNIPVLGYAFKQDTITEIREELVVIITPHIINPSNKTKSGHLSLKDLGYQGIR
jgi:general secretion pathway protein D